MQDIFLGGSRTQPIDTSGASPLTAAAVNYVDVQVNGSDYSVDVPATLVVWGATTGGSLVVKLFEVNDDLSLGAVLVADDTPFTLSAEAKHEVTLPVFSGVKTLRLVGVLTGGVDAATWFLGVVRALVSDVDEFPVDCVALQTALCNKALGHIGISDLLDNVDSDTGVNATMCRLYLTGATHECLRVYDWAWATKYADLTYVGGADGTPVNQDWTYSYRLPTDCVKLRRVINAGLKRTADSNPPAFRQGGNDGGGRLVFADYVDPASADPAAPTLPVEYTSSLDCTLGSCDDIFAEALSWLMASHLAPSLARNKVTAADAMGVYRAKLTTAAVIDANAQQRQRPDDGQNGAEWMDARL